MKPSIQSTIPFRAVALCGLFLCQLNLLFFPSALAAADASGITERTKETVKDATAAVQKAANDASRAAGKSFDDLWRRFDESRITNRTRDEIVAWVIMGVLVGAVAGMMLLALWFLLPLPLLRRARAEPDDGEGASPVGGADRRSNSSPT